jgi:hypothetical protein
MRSMSGRATPDNQGVLNSRVPDCKRPEMIKELVKSTLRAIFASHYERDLTEKAKTENEIILEEFIEKLVSAQSIDDFCELLKTGHLRGNVQIDLESFRSPHYFAVQKALLANPGIPLKHLEVLWSGVHKGME